MSAVELHAVPSSGSVDSSRIDSKSGAASSASPLQDLFRQPSQQPAHERKLTPLRPPLLSVDVDGKNARSHLLKAERSLSNLKPERSLSRLSKRGENEPQRAPRKSLSKQGGTFGGFSGVASPASPRNLAGSGGRRPSDAGALNTLDDDDPDLPHVSLCLSSDSTPCAVLGARRWRWQSLSRVCLSCSRCTTAPLPHVGLCSQVARSKWLVDPDGQFKVYFDYVILALLLYSIIW